MSGPALNNKMPKPPNNLEPKLAQGSKFVVKKEENKKTENKADKENIHKKKKKELSFQGLSDQSKRFTVKKSKLQKFVQFLNEGPLDGIAKWSGFIAAMLAVNALTFAQNKTQKLWSWASAGAIAMFGLLKDFLVSPFLSKIAKPAEESKICLDKDIVWDNKEKFLHVLKQFLGYRSVVQTSDPTKEVGTQSGNILILSGPPGTGKTAVAKGVANLLNKKLLPVNISHIIDKYVGESEKKLRALFERARSEPDVLLFFDEADGLFMPRNAPEAKPHHVSFTNAFIQEFNDSGIKIIAATNHAGKIDEAVESRSMHFHMPKPNAELRFKILIKKLQAHNLRKQDFDLLVKHDSKALQEITEDYDFTGRDIESAIKRSMHVADKRIQDLKDEGNLRAEDNRLLVTDLKEGFESLAQEKDAALSSSSPLAPILDLAKKLSIS